MSGVRFHGVGGTFGGTPVGARGPSNGARVTAGPYGPGMPRTDAQLEQLRRSFAMLNDGQTIPVERQVGLELIAELLELRRAVRPGG